MRKKNLLLGVAALLLLCSTNDKNYFDLKQEISNKKSDSYSGERMHLSNGWYEMTLMNGGFFTIGTISGHPSTPFDDYCQVTYGHPYAFTSFPLVQMDDQWETAADLYSNLPQDLQVMGDTLSWTAQGQPGLKFTFMMILPDTAGTITFISEILPQQLLFHI